MIAAGKSLSEAIVHPRIRTEEGALKANQEIEAKKKAAGIEGTQ